MRTLFTNKAMDKRAVILNLLTFLIYISLLLAISELFSQFSVNYVNSTKTRQIEEGLSGKHYFMIPPWEIRIIEE